MTIYRFEAVSHHGRRKKGTIDADSFELAKDKLRKQGIMITKLIPFEPKAKSLHLKGSWLIAFTRDVAVLLKSGLPLYETLLTIEEKNKEHPCQPLLLDLCDEIKRGEHLSKALAKYPKSFDPVYISMVRAGEETGRLEEVFAQVAELLSRSEGVKKQIISAMIYPLFLLTFCAIVTSALLFFLIPSLQDLFEGRTLHPMTQAVLGLSHFLRSHVLLLGVLLIGTGCALYVTAQRTPFFRHLALRIPYLGRLITQAVLQRFARVFGVLLESGVPMLDALRLAKAAMHHDAFEGVMQKTELHIIEGGKLSEGLETSPLIPKLFTRMLKVAEEAGHMEGMLKNIADIYEEELTRSLQRFTALLQPVLLLILGLIVGLILLSVLLPLTDVSSMIN